MRSADLEKATMSHDLKLENLMREEFDAPTRIKGLEYFRENRVSTKKLHGDVAQFQVKGTQRYSVYLSHADDTVSSGPTFNFECTCPHYLGGNLCKHIWAVILKIDRSQLLPIFLKKPVVPPPSQIQNTSDQLPTWKDIIEQAQRKVERDQRYSSVSGFARNKAPLKNTNARIGTYVIDRKGSEESNQIRLALFVQERLKTGSVGTLKAAELTHDKIQYYEDLNEKDFLWDLIGRTELVISQLATSTPENKISTVALTSGHADGILRQIYESGKLFSTWESTKPFQSTYGRTIEDKIRPCTYEVTKWNFRLNMQKTIDGFLLCGELVNEDFEVREINTFKAYIDHFIFFEDSIARSDISLHTVWLELVKNRPLFIPQSEIDVFLDYYWNQVGAKVPIELPAEIQLLERSDILPKPRITFESSTRSGVFELRVSFDYQGLIAYVDGGSSLYDIVGKIKIIRQHHHEKEVCQQLQALQLSSSEDPQVQGNIAGKDFIATVEKCISFGWQVFAKDQKIVSGSDFHMSMSSGIDWFDLKAEVKYDQQLVLLPQLLAALKSGQRLIPLDDGTVGILPAQWLKKFAPLQGVAKIGEEGLRLNKVQALFFSASLEEGENLTIDKKFQMLKQIISELQNMEPERASTRLKGELRSYQEVGLAWLKLLSKHEIGGILADDMGLGKTIQVLALLAEKPTSKKPSLVLAPKSLVFNWQSEAAKFTPHLKTLIYAGTGRQELLKQVLKYDLIITTYQTLRNDIELFSKLGFNYLILDEAHNLKNARSQITMAAKLIPAERKLALTGTPIENSLSDLFSILSVVMPGLVSEAQAVRWSKEAESVNMQVLARALRPFMLRRTKDQVLKDLPEKTEQILYCELSDAERKKYNELRSYYWSNLSGKIQENGLAKSKIDVLEGLLRLRQAACHYGLLDKTASHLSSTKFDLVIEQLESVIKDGHKALVFSQFTSLLGLFAQQLAHRKVSYEYLDGQTRDRAERVHHFQTDQDCQVFLLSLKAGGVGLNLTAADYVFILDPWWNPAAESQAIDRTHRIGQTKKVFAYKIIAKNTVEEKILALQEKKKKLARVVISDDANVLRNLSLEDLRDLFH